MDIQNVMDHIIPILKNYHVKKASLFGSVVSGTMHKDSDVDMLVEMPEKATLFDLLGVKIDLEEKLGRKVDIIEYKGIKPALKKDILSHHIVIYQQI